MIEIEADFSEMEEAAEALEAAAVEVREQIPTVMGKAVLVLEREAKVLAPVDTGRLRSSIASEVRGAAMETVGVVGSNVEYAPYVELGTKPHFPPYRPGTPLGRWAELHGVSAFAVALVISRRGTKARKFLQGAFEHKRDEVVKLFVELVKRIEV